MGTADQIVEAPRITLAEAAAGYPVAGKRAEMPVEEDGPLKGPWQSG